MTVELPVKLAPLPPAVTAGRISTEAVTAARAGAWQSRCWSWLQAQIVHLCARETSNSIADSVHRSLEMQIDRLGMYLRDQYDVGKAVIGTAGPAVRFIFKNTAPQPRLESNPSKAVTSCGLRKPRACQMKAGGRPFPPVRRPSSEIWVTWNPRQKD